jgi:hypothetical protein
LDIGFDTYSELHEKGNISICLIKVKHFIVFKSAGEWLSKLMYTFVLFTYNIMQNNNVRGVFTFYFLFKIKG